MASTTKNEKGKSICFTFSKTKTASKLVPTNKEYENDDKEPNSKKDFVHSAEGKQLQSATKPKEAAKELVIPCLPRTDLLFPLGMGDMKANNLDRQAVEEIMKELSKAETTDNETEKGFAIPLLVKTHLATPNESSNSGPEPAVVTKEESTLDDYNAIPVSQFGAAMLRGMGWIKGEAIGGTNKGLAVPIEFIPRSQGLGLGAERKHEENRKKKRRKPGDAKSSEHSGPIIEKDGKVRHFKTLDEKIPEKQIHQGTFLKGGYVVVESGPHKDLSGQITALDEDNARIYVRFAINSEGEVQASKCDERGIIILDMTSCGFLSEGPSYKAVTVSQHNVRIVDKDEYKQYSKGNPSKHNENNHRKTKRQRDEEQSENNRDYSPKKHKSKHKKDSRDKAGAKGSSRDNNEHETSEDADFDNHELCWMAPLIRVRIISKTFKKGTYYHKKVIIQDVISRTTCLCRTDENRLLEDVPQSVLETVIPKNNPGYILFVQGKYKGLIGEIVETGSSKQQAIIQILRDKNVVKSHYDDISEYTGDVHRE